MTQRTNLDDDLGRWMHDSPTQAPAPLLASIRAGVAVTEQRRRRGWGSGWRRSTLAIAQAAAGVAVVAGLGFGIVYLASGAGQGGTGAPSTMPAAVSTAPASAAPASAVASVPASAPASGEGAATQPPSAPPSVAITPTLQLAACGPANATARITSWQGAAGQRIATVVLTNRSTSSCTLPAQSRPQLVDGSGRVLIDSPAAAKSTAITLGAGKHLTTLVEDGNYCGPAPAAPVRIALILRSGERVIASAPTPTDVTVPPCNGSAVKADIQMHPWSG